MKLLANVVSAVEPSVVSTAIESADKARHKFARIRIDGLDPMHPIVDVDTGFLGVDRVISMTPKPINGFFHVVWNGDGINPKLAFFGPDLRGPLDVEIEIWGT